MSSHSRSLGTDPAELLRVLLDAIIGEYNLINLAEQSCTDPDPGWVLGKDGSERPVHIVCDVEFDRVLGRGMSEDEAIADAIRRVHEETAEGLSHCRSTVRSYLNARAALKTL